MRLKEEVALITGGGRGIGRAIALRFAREGAAVVLAGRSLTDLQAVEKEIRALGREALALFCDVGEDSSVQAMVQQAEARFGKIDLVVNNAGYFCSMASLQEMPDAEWDITVQANLTGAFYVCRATVAGMIARRHGSIILISSIGAKEAYPYAVPYSAAKAGLLGLTRALAAEVGPYGVRVNALCPGVVAGTEMHDKVSRELQRMTGVLPEERLAAARNSALLRQLPNPEAVAEAALFLACPESSAITGQSLNVDGGMCFS
ncbi:MAG: SDR family oxidoreductase [Acidobacteria bacterium]|nr:SDR family oxidoreductase [Acidobacteriota bacterium]